MSENNAGERRRGRRESSLSALLKEKPRRGRPRRAVERQNVYVILDASQKAALSAMAEALPAGLKRADVPDLAVALMSARLEALQRAVAGRSTAVPEGITDLGALYLLWDLPLPPPPGARWTSIRLSPQQVVQLGSAQGTLNALFGATRSDVFALALTLLSSFQAQLSPNWSPTTLEASLRWINDYYL